MGVYRSCLPRRSGGHQGCSPPNIHPPRPARRGGSALAPLLTKPALSAADSHGKTHAVMRAAADKGTLRALLPVLRRPRVEDGIARGRT